VDIHVFRISNRIFFHPHPSRNPEETERRLEKIFPAGRRSAINSVLVKFGQNICLPRNPLCPECPVKTDCPSAQIGPRRG
jgi:endonuclease-3